MVANYLRGGAAVNVLARRAGAEVRVVDLGVANREAFAGLTGGGLHSRPDRPPARRTSSKARRCPGPTPSAPSGSAWNWANRWAGDEGFRVVALGEMGIGNTTTAAALIAALTGAPAADGRRPGDGRRRRDPRPQAAGGRRRRSSGTRPRRGATSGTCSPGSAVSKSSGWRAWRSRPRGTRALVVLDGLISTTAGLIAATVCPAVVGSLVAAHVGPEPGHRVALDALGLRPLLDLGLRLGEGTGAALALPLIASAADLLREMATFEEQA